MMPEAADCLVFVVAAEPDLARMITGRFDCAVEFIADGRDALARLQVATPALLLLDLEVVDFDILADIRQQTRLAATRIVVVTADVVCAHGLGGRVDGELLKPVRPDDLAALITQLPGLPFAVGGQSDSY